jgi:septal ring factor EnvC (AmiA/AmiB activator)
MSYQDEFYKCRDQYLLLRQQLSECNHGIRSLEENLHRVEAENTTLRKIIAEQNEVLRKIIEEQRPGPRITPSMAPRLTGYKPSYLLD